MQAMSESLDSISNLPDTVLVHILSFFTTRQAVQMSLLSKRWVHLWTSIPSLHFCDSEFRTSIPSLHFGLSPIFFSFIDEVLKRRGENNNITKFHFSVYKLMDARIVRKWILHAVRGGKVQELTIESKTEDFLSIKLPPCLFACKSLRALKLDMGKLDLGRYDLELPTTLCESSLKSLHLGSFVSNELQRLISYCPFLEDLYLSNLYCGDLKISAQRLQRLTIYGSMVATIDVSAPSLLSFNFNNWGATYCLLKNFVSLVEADLIFYSTLTGCDHRRILEGISNASSLTLTYKGILRQDLPDKLPMFGNLTFLVLNICFDKQRIEGMINILEHSPNLKALVIYNLGSRHKLEELCCWLEKQQSNQFLRYLRKIKVKNLHSSAMHLESW